jgi:CheY-like chemotaxis protein
MTAKEVEILIVEDNHDDLDLMLHALKKQNLCNNIQVARDGEEALDFVFCRGKFAERGPNGHPRLILLDLKLPKVDGLEVLRQLKLNSSTRSIPVVVLTTSSEERDMVASYQLGVNSYLQKPVDFTEFCKMVKEIGFYWLLVNRTLEAAPAGVLFRAAEASGND